MTDHDTTAGCGRALAYGSSQALKVIPGIELSVFHNEEEIHLLGYFNPTDYDSAELTAYTQQKCEDRRQRCQAMLDLLECHFGFHLDMQNFSGSHAIMLGRPMIAREMVRLGYAKTTKELMTTCLSKKSPVYIPSSCLPLQKGLDLLRRNNAVVVLAHPVLIKNSKVEDILSAYGFDGIEAFYGENTPADTIRVLTICKERHLLALAVSDFHDVGTYRHSDIGEIALLNPYLADFLAKFT